MVEKVGVIYVHHVDVVRSGSVATPCAQVILWCGPAVTCLFILGRVSVCSAWSALAPPRGIVRPHRVVRVPYPCNEKTV